MILCTVFALCAFAQPVDPTTVVAKIGGRDVTAGELQGLLRSLPQQSQQNFLRDGKGFLHQIALMKKMSELAEASKLQEMSPYKEQIAFNRMFVLFNAQSSDMFNQIVVTGEDQQKFYEQNTDRYSQARVKVIYLSFSSAPAAEPKDKKVLTEAEANAKAEKLLKEIRAGADFVKLAKAHSEDPASVAKDAEFGAIRRSDKIPDNIKTAIFALKPGQTSEPVRAPNGFYLFRLEEFSTQPYSEVKDDIFTEIKQSRFRESMDKLQNSLDVKILNESFFAGGSGVPAPAPPK
ncbi:MAG: peptidylprolyl isomerase [Bryobacteraceae bacterium]